MSSLYEIIPGIQLTSNEILEAELFAQQILQSKYPDLDLREGTAIRDLVIRPTATLLATINKSMAYYFAQNTIAGITDDSPSDFLDNIMSNWFLTRKQGTKAVINARLFFARQKSVSISSSVFFSTDNVLKFYPSSSISLPSTALTYDAYNQEYYIDIDLTSENSGSEYNISSGSLLYFTNFDPYFLRAEINYLSDAANDVETNSEFITRASTAISTRNLINIPSIESKLKEEFSVISNILPIGYGDEEMIRDMVSVIVPGVVSPVLIHNGGMIDIYCNTGLATKTVQLLANATGDMELTGPVYKVERSSISGGDEEDTIPLTTSSSVISLTSSAGIATATVTNHGYSTGQEVTISGANETGYNLTVVITVIDANTFTYPAPLAIVTPATGTILSTIDMPFSVSNIYTYSLALTSLTSSSGIATATYANHGFPVNRYVTISGANQAEYNGSFIITEVTKDTFTFSVPTGITTPATGTIVATITNPTYDVGFSERQKLKIAMGTSNANKTASFTVSYFDYLEGIQTFLEGADNKVLCADPLARGFNIYLLDVIVTAYTSVAPDSVTCDTVIKSYLSNLQPGQVFVMADLLSKLYESGITGIKTPLSVVYTRYTRDLLPPTTGIITDVLDPNDVTSIFVLNSVSTNTQGL